MGAQPRAPASPGSWPVQLPQELLSSLRAPQTFLLADLSGKRAAGGWLVHHAFRVARTLQGPQVACSGRDDLDDLDAGLRDPGAAGQAAVLGLRAGGAAARARRLLLDRPPQPDLPGAGAAAGRRAGPLPGGSRAGAARQEGLRR